MGLWNFHARVDRSMSRIVALNCRIEVGMMSFEAVFGGGGFREEREVGLIRD